MSQFGPDQPEPEEWADPLPPELHPRRTPPHSLEPFALPTPDSMAMDEIAALIRGGQTDMLARIEEAVARTGRLQLEVWPADSLTGVPGPANDADGASELDVTPEDRTP
jgi:hypothetical protein